MNGYELLQNVSALNWTLENISGRIKWSYMACVDLCALLKDVRSWPLCKLPPARPHFHSSDEWSTGGVVQVYYPVWEMLGSLVACLLPLFKTKQRHMTPVFASRQDCDTTASVADLNLIPYLNTKTTIGVRTVVKTS